MIPMFIGMAALAQEAITDPAATEVWSPVPAVITPGEGTLPPSDAIVLLGQDKDLSQWVAEDGGKVKWNMKDYGGKWIIEPDSVTEIGMILPILFGKIPNGSFSVKYKDELVHIDIRTINKKEEDPIFEYEKFIGIGTDDSGLEFIPFEAFTDNRGEYPTTFVTLIFSRRIATWIDAKHETRIKMDHDYEKIQITYESTDYLLFSWSFINVLPNR